MELEQIFYAVATVFGLAALVYFTWEYVEYLPRITKTFLLFGLVVVFFLMAGLLQQPQVRAKRRRS